MIPQDIENDWLKIISTVSKDQSEYNISMVHTVNSLKEIFTTNVVSFCSQCLFDNKPNTTVWAMNISSSMQ